MKSKKFRDLSNGRIVEVTDHFEDILILDGKNKIKMDQLLNKKMFEEYVDPNAFLKNEGFVNSFFEQIKRLPLDDLKNRIPADEMGYDDDDIRPNMNESAVLPYDPEIEKEELLKKAKSVYTPNNVNSMIQKQREALKQILSDEDDEISNNPVLLENNQNITISSQQPQPQVIQEQQIKEEKRMDPILEMFKNVKRNTSFKIEFTVENKIPRVDFIEMMEDSYNTSIIDFLAQEFTEEIVKDPSVIKEKIKGKLMDLVYPEVENKRKAND